MSFSQWNNINQTIFSTLNTGLQNQARDKNILRELEANSSYQREEQIKFTTYQNPTLGITIQYPSNWEKIEADNNVHFLSPLESNFDPYREGVSIYILPPQNLPLDTCVNMQINNLKQTLPTFL